MELVAEMVSSIVHAPGMPRRSMAPGKMAAGWTMGRGRERVEGRPVLETKIYAGSYPPFSSAGPNSPWTYMSYIAGMGP